MTLPLKNDLIVSDDTDYSADEENADTVDIKFVDSYDCNSVIIKVSRIESTLIYLQDKIVYVSNILTDILRKENRFNPF